ncbi:MAG: MvaI/BcnI family restriction endonuclease [Pyrinomonadaceae bacterium]
MAKSKSITLEDFREKFTEIKRMGWVASKRRSSTGVGYTLETLLGIEENNIALPDFGTVELKSHRVKSTSMVTLFTFDRKVWRMNPLQAVRKYGTRDANERLGLYFTMSPTPTSTGLFLHIEPETISVRHHSGEVVAEWSLEALARQFMKKMPALVLVSALSEMRGDTEYFNYTSARLLERTSPEILREQILAGNVLVDLRVHDRPTSARNRGTGFRARKNSLPLLFSSITEL